MHDSRPNSQAMGCVPCFFTNPDVDPRHNKAVAAPIDRPHNAIVDTWQWRRPNPPGCLRFSCEPWKKTPTNSWCFLKFHQVSFWMSLVLLGRRFVVVVVVVVVAGGDDSVALHSVVGQTSDNFDQSKQPTDLSETLGPCIGAYLLRLSQVLNDFLHIILKGNYDVKGLEGNRWKLTRLLEKSWLRGAAYVNKRNGEEEMGSAPRTPHIGSGIWEYVHGKEPNTFDWLVMPSQSKLR